MNQVLMQLLTPVGSILAGLLAGFIFEKVILGRLIKISARTKWGGDEVIIQALRGSVVFGFIIAGIYGATFSIPIPVAALNVIHKILQIILIFIVTMIGSRIAGGLLDIYMNHEAGFLPSASILTNLVKILVYGIGILITLQSLGISITPILTALGVGGLAVALALQDTLSNLFSGLQIIASRDIKPGDYIKLNTGEEGHVADISWRNTSIRALPNNLVVVPNAKLAGAIITNYQRPQKELSFSVDIIVGYQSDLEHVEQVTLEVAKEILQNVEGGVRNFEPMVRFKSLDAAGITFAVGLRAREFADQFLIRHHLIKALFQRYAQEGIEIPFPSQNVYLKQTEPNKPGQP
ncbi:MAG TPA: mechanosensitive ion channel family protein [Bacillota bacterium]|nr:mechanosensitive ion channel family protein [Bacillota bacterium]